MTSARSTALAMLLSPERLAALEVMDAALAGDPKPLRAWLRAHASLALQVVPGLKVATPWKDGMRYNGTISVIAVATVWETKGRFFWSTPQAAGEAETEAEARAKADAALIDQGWVLG